MPGTKTRSTPGRGNPGCELEYSVLRTKILRQGRSARRALGRRVNWGFTRPLKVVLCEGARRFPARRDGERLSGKGLQRPPGLGELSPLRGVRGVEGRALEQLELSGAGGGEKRETTVSRVA